MAEQYSINKENRWFTDKPQPVAYPANPYKNLAHLPLRQVEQLLLSEFAVEELKPQHQQPRASNW